MKRIFIVFLCFVVFPVFSQEGRFTRITETTTDFRNNIWFYGSNSFEDITQFFNKFDSNFVNRTIAQEPGGRTFNSVSEPERSVLMSLLNRGRNIAIPDTEYQIMIITDNRYGVSILWWYDTTPAVIMGVGPGSKVMSRYFFELKSVR